MYLNKLTLLKENWGKYLNKFNLSKIPFHTSKISRYFATLKPAGGMYYEVPRTVIPSGVDFEWEFELAPNATSFFVAGDSTSTFAQSARLVFTGNLYYGMGFDASPSNSGGGWGSDGKLHKLKISRVGGNVTIRVDDVIDATTTYTGGISFDGIGRKFGGTTSIPTFNGSFFSSKLTVPSNSTLNHHYRFDDNDGVLVDYSKPLIPIAALTRFNNATGGTATWVNNDDGSTTMTTNGSQSYGYNGWSFPAEEGKQYLYSISSDKGARLVVYAFTQGLTDYVGVASDAESSKTSRGLTSTIPEGKNRLLVIHQVNVNFGADTLTTQVATAALADGYGQAVNVTAADRELMTFDESRNAWIGGELISLQNWENPASAGSNWSYVHPDWVLVGDGSPSSLQPVLTSSQPESMIITGYVVELQGELALCATNYTQVVRDKGYYEFTINKAINTTQQFKRAAGFVNATVSRPSLKRIIEVAK